jgi:hypothetical protein
MELDNLKYVWKRLELDIPAPDHNDQILEMIARRSLDPVAKMKRNLLIELVLAILFYAPLTIWYVFDFNGKLPEVSGFLLLILLLFIVYYYRKYKLLNQMQNISYPLKENLEHQIGTLEKYLRVYLIMGLLIPLCILFLGVLMYVKLPQPSGPTWFYADPTRPLWKVALLWIGMLVVASIFIYFADRWYVNKLYRGHIRKLKALLREING